MARDLSAASGATREGERKAVGHRLHHGGNWLESGRRRVSVGHDLARPDARDRRVDRGIRPTSLRGRRARGTSRLENALPHGLSKARAPRQPGCRPTQDRTQRNAGTRNARGLEVAARQRRAAGRSRHVSIRSGQRDATGPRKSLRLVLSSDDRRLSTIRTANRSRRPPTSCRACCWISTRNSDRTTNTCWAHGWNGPNVGRPRKKSGGSTNGTPERSSHFGASPPHRWTITPIANGPA